MEKDVAGIPVLEQGQGGVESVALADGAEVEVERGELRPAPGGDPGDREAGPGPVDPDEPGQGRTWEPPDAAPDRRGAGPVVDVEGAGRFRLDERGQPQDLGRLQPDGQGLAGPEPPDAADLARGVETAEQALQTVDLAEGGPGGLPGVGFLAAGDEDLEDRGHGLVGEARDPLHAPAFGPSGSSRTASEGTLRRAATSRSPRTFSSVRKWTSRRPSEWKPVRK